MARGGEVTPLPSPDPDQLAESRIRAELARAVPIDDVGPCVRSLQNDLENRLYGSLSMRFGISRKSLNCEAQTRMDEALPYGIVFECAQFIETRWD